MARNGSGTMQGLNNSWSPPINGQLAAAGDWQAIYLDLIAALTQSLSRDGQGGMLGNLPMGGNKITGLSDGTGTGQAVSFAQLFNQGTEQDLASAATTDIGAQLTNFLRITGTTTITSFGTNYKGPRFLRFEGAVTLTNSSTLILPGGANITTAAGDCLIVVPKATLGTADGWQVVAYQKNAVPGAIADGSVTTAKIADGSVTTAKISDAAVTGAKLADGAASGTKLASKIEPVTASVASNALTVTLNPTTLDFRSSTLGSGTVNTRTVATAISAVVPSGATLGTANATLSKVMLLAIDNAGTVELAVCNGSLSLDESTLISTTVLDTASDSASVIYSTIARTNVPFRIVGYVESTQSTAGTWAASPSKIQGIGGAALQQDVKAALNATGSAPIYACRAWVNFNGVGTVAIRASGNVSSITDNGVGLYTVNFTTAMPDANYSVGGSALSSNTNTAAALQPVTLSTSSVAIKTMRAATTGSANDDADPVCVQIFR